MIRLVSMLLLVLPGALAAQQMGPAPVRAGVEVLTAPDLVAPKNSLTALRVALPPVSGSELAALRAHNAVEKVLQVGIGRPLPDPYAGGIALADLGWRTLADGGRVATLEFASPDAAALRVGIAAASFPHGITLRTYAAARDGSLHGAVDAASLAGGPAIAWLPEQPGDILGVELHAAAGTDVSVLVLPAIRLMHLLVTPHDWDDKRLDEIQDGFEAGSCNNDIACAGAEWVEIGRAVAKYIFVIDEQAGEGGLCTGTLVNNIDDAPRFLTARHCLTTPARAQSSTFYWGFERMTCGGPPPDDPSDFAQTTGGMELLAVEAQFDMVIAELNNAPPPSAMLAGWDANTPVLSSPVVAIHHPQGELKSWSLGAIDMFTAFSGTAHSNNGSHIRVTWNDGTTEQGSSGSGLFDDDGLVIGTLHGGSASCDAPNDPDYYGRLEFAYDSFWQFMGGTPPEPRPDPPPAPTPPADGGGGGHGGLLCFAGLVALVRARSHAWTTRSSSSATRSGRRSAPTPS